MLSQNRSFIRSSVGIVVVIAACAAAAGMWTGGRVSAAPPNDDSISQSMKAFTSVFDVVEQNFADKVDADKAIYNGAVPGMLRTLDPHSNFFDPKAYAALREDQRGQYYGVGMQVGPRNGKTMIMWPFENSPAYRAGLRPGDVIAQINDKKTDGLNTTEIAELLKGPRGTKVQVRVSREGLTTPVVYDIVRDAIARPSVPEAIWLKPGIAYMNVTQFGENTSKEFEEQFRKLGENNIKGLVLDLRGNPGGLLNEGVEVAGHFLKKNDLVVSHRGRAQPNKNYYSKSDNGGKTGYPVVVVVNRSSASAAEIVSGALQDHDRAWVLGEPTFGKGLVQTVFPLSENTGLALTTAHYYTPSGRLIQRDYSHISFLDYYYRNKNEQKDLSDVKMTDAGRTVYGGGGITPDEKYEAAKLNKFQIELLRKSGFFNFSAAYFGPKTDARMPKGWEPDENIVNQLHDYLLKNTVEFTEADFTANHQWVKEQLKREMYITAFSWEQSVRVNIQQDPEIARAVDAMPKAVTLLENAKKLLVQRVNQQERLPR
ncbi:MAG: S41 family peptidase [Bryobacterales bacterium]|nr:S41 family peptidase [Bryobacterales bacterium]